MIENAGLVERLEWLSRRHHISYAERDTVIEAAQRIRELEAALAAETERCARVADAAVTKNERAARGHHPDSDSRSRCQARGREALAIAAAIRAGAPK